MDKRRTYVQTARAASTQATRERILEAAEASFERGPLAAVKIDDVARRAGVSRSTVYQLFESRAGLLVALADRLRQQAGFDRLVEASRHPDARESFRLATARVVPDVRRHPGPDAGPVHARRPRRRRGRGGRAARARPAPGHAAARARRLHEQGQLRDGVSVTEATHLLTVVTSFPSFDELYHALGLPVDVVADRLIALGERAVCRDAA